MAMNSLQFWLAVIGVAALALLLGHGAWQTRRAGAALLRRDTPADARHESADSRFAVTQALEPHFDSAFTRPTEPATLDEPPANGARRQVGVEGAPSVSGDAGSAGTRTRIGSAASPDSGARTAGAADGPPSTEPPVALSGVAAASTPSREHVLASPATADPLASTAPPSPAEVPDPADPTEVALPLRRHPPPLPLDVRLDAIAELQLPHEVSGDLVLAHLPASRRAGGKPLRVEARRSDTGAWESPAPGQRYAAVCAGVQVAHRLGAINEIEFTEFAQKLQPLADALGAELRLPDMLEAVARGRELDALAGEHDALLAVSLTTRQTPWPLSWVTQHAARHGFITGATPGRLVLPPRTPGGPPMLTLQFDPQAALADDPREARVGEIALVFDVPQTSPLEEPFNAWCAASQALALALDAQIGDDAGRELGPNDFAAIGAALQRRYQALEALGLPAGSVAARRLFS